MPRCQKPDPGGPRSAIVAGMAGDGSAVGGVAIDTSRHGSRFLFDDHIPFADGPVATLAGDTRLHVMHLVGKEDVVRQAIDAHPGHGLMQFVVSRQVEDRRALAPDRSMALHASFFGGIAHFPPEHLMAFQALQERSVPTVAEGNGLSLDWLLHVGFA